MIFSGGEIRRINQYKIIVAVSVLTSQAAFFFTGDGMEFTYIHADSVYLKYFTGFETAVNSVIIILLIYCYQAVGIF